MIDQMNVSDKKNNQSGVITFNQLLSKFEKKAELEFSDDNKRHQNIGYLLSTFQSMCNTILLLIEVFLNFLVVLFSETDIGKKIFRTFVNVWLSYIEFGILTASYTDYCIKKEDESFYNDLKEIPVKLTKLIIDFDNKIYPHYQPIIKEKYDSIV
jgi:amino acid permease